MNPSKSVKISAAIAGCILFLALILQSVLFNGGLYKLLPVWLLVFMVVVNIILNCIPKVREKKVVRMVCQVVCVIVAGIVVTCLYR